MKRKDIKERKQKRVTNEVRIAENAAIDKGDGIIEFNKGLVISDGSEQRNGTRYDIESMDLSEFSGLLTVNHDREVQSVVAKVSQPIKKAGKVLVESFEFAVNESSLAIFVYNMMRGGFIRDFSIETIGPWENDEGVYEESKLVGLSAVVIGNNKSARLKNSFDKVVTNSLDESENRGLDTSALRKLYLEGNNLSSIKKEAMFVTIKNTRDFDVVVKFVNASKEEIEMKLAPSASVDVEESQAEEVNAQIKNAVNPTPKEDMAVKELKSTIEALNDSIEALKKEVANVKVNEPKFKKGAKAAIISNEFGTMDWKTRTGVQVQEAWNWLKGKNAESQQKLVDINKLNFELLQEAGLVDNQITITDMGNFVIAPELLADIQGHRSNFSAFLEAMEWKETLSLQMGWLERNGDVNMEEVEACDDGADGNLKPISEYTATAKTSNLHEVAAVTPVCTAATRFLAVDLLGDVAQGYRTDYDRKRAQIAIARMQQAVDASGQQIDYDPATDLSALKSWIEIWGEAQEEIMNGVFVFSQKTYSTILSAAVGAGISGPLAGLFTTGDVPTLLGNKFVIVPNELLPALGTNETKEFVVEGATVSIHDSVFYFDPTVVTGRTSGGLQYDLSTDASYEVGGEVRSAFQRNELVLRGSMFRGAAVKDAGQVVGLGTEGLS